MKDLKEVVDSIDNVHYIRYSFKKEFQQVLTDQWLVIEGVSVKGSEKYLAFSTSVISFTLITIETGPTVLQTGEPD